ncbi:DUF983 domain-containing protein [Porifericola rhodea]|uniref:DUF983 domain-containing protein n=1 Tax=Porifericola rhodea TaxID=930972 RepID=UPI002665E602|nr:DUF983 domain-containing protein [Porifericola rhodea]WKN30343.1 DUF983 domain-containing protein [Porifericola rhodea]
MWDIIKNIKQEKCPNCHAGEVFKTKGNVLLFKTPEMKPRCSNCGYSFEKEPGYFTGAMYVSYALIIAEMIIAFILFSFTPISLDYLIYLVLLPVILLWPFNFRMSRIIWMNLI